MTNGEKIRAMSDEEMAIEISKFNCGFCEYCPADDLCKGDEGVTSCKDALMRWLKEEAK